MPQRLDTSSISFTALYTGQVWVRNGLSEPCFHTRSGALLYGAMTPLEMVGKGLLGGNIRTFLLQRHHLLDARLDAVIEQYPDLQVVEIACGLSPRGYRFVQRHTGITYVEADLPDMARRKRALLASQGTLNHRHRVETVNILLEQGGDSVQALLERLDPERPVVVITEGLINYFSLPAISPFWQRLAQALRVFPDARYLTDNYPLYANRRFQRTVRALGGVLGVLSRSQVRFHFTCAQDSRAHFLAMGFQALSIHDPADYYQCLPIPRTRGTPMVRILEAIAAPR